MRSIITAALLFSLFLTVPAHAQTYYVDAINGNDSWSGTLPSAQGTDGPWQTISRVNSASLLPGDQVLFQCGQIWREELVVPTSGTSSSPITFSRYGSCTGNNNPVFSGADLMGNWQPASGYIYTTAATLIHQPVSLIVNGDFDIDTYGWTNGYTGGQVSWQANCGLSGGCLEMSSVSDYGNWVQSTPDFNLPPGNYELDFSLRGGEVGSGYRVSVAGNQVWLDQMFSNSGTWQSYTYTFTVTSPSNEHVYFRDESTSSVPPPFYVDNVRLVPTSAQYDPARQVLIDGSPALLAQYPNPSPSDPTDTYLQIANNSTGCPNTGYPGVSSFVAGNLGSADTSGLVGAGIHIRINDYMIDDRTVTGFDPNTNTITLDSPTTFNLCQGWGFYFDDMAWMLDEPGEWYYDGSLRQLSAWMPDSSAPASRVQAAHRDYGIDARDRAYLVIDSISINGYQTGIDLSHSLNVTVQNSTVSNSGVNGIVANGAASATIQNCDVEGAVRSGIYATASTNLSVLNNTVNNGGRVGSPKQSEAAVVLRLSSGAVTGNRVTNSGYIGIAGGTNSTVSQNVVDDSCMNLNDCGGIYTSAYASGTTGTHTPVNTTYAYNIVRRVHGNSNGRPSDLGPNVRGIYLDGGDSYVTVTNNTVSDSPSDGIWVGESDHNTIENNTVYGTVATPVMVAELPGSAGTTYQNVFQDNVLFPPQAPNVLRGRYDYAFMTDLNGAFLPQEAGYYLVDYNSDASGTSLFGSFDYDRYSNIYSRLPIQELNGATQNYYSLPQWQQQFSQDANATAFNPFSNAHYEIAGALGASFVPNGTFTGFTATNPTNWLNWSAWNGTFFVPTDCVTNCLGYMLNNGATVGNVGGGNNISLTLGQYYLVHFDLRALTDGQQVEVSAFGSGNSTHPNAQNGLDLFITANKAWETYGYVFQANATDPSAVFVVDVYNQNAGTEGIELANVRVQPIGAPGVTFNNATGDSAILINATTQADSFSCPDSTKCSNYVNFSDGSPVTWPMTVPALSSQIVVWSANPFRDTDHDGVPDIQDACPGTYVDPITNSSSPVDENGCSFAQSHPADLALTQTVSPTSVLLGSNTTYTLTVNNLGPSTAHDVVLNDPLPAGVAFINVSTGQGTCNPGQMVGCSLGNLEAGATVTVTVTAQATVVGMYTSQAAVSMNESDANPSNNTASVITTVIAPDIIPTAFSASKSGNKVIVSDTVKNQGTAAAGSFVVGYFLSTTTTYNPSAVLPLASTSGGSTPCTRTVSSLAIGATSSVSNMTCYKPANTVTGQRYYVLVVDDSNNQVIESNETNNVMTSTGQVWW